MSTTRKFYCLTCSMTEPLDSTAIAQHVREVHHEGDGRDMKGRSTQLPDEAGAKVFRWDVQPNVTIKEVQETGS